MFLDWDVSQMGHDGNKDVKSDPIAPLTGRITQNQWLQVPEEGSKISSC